MRAKDWFSKKSTATPAAQHGSNPRGSAVALLALRAAIKRQGRNDAELEHLRMPVLEYCTLARQENIEPQQMLICVKKALDGFPFTAQDTPASREATRARIIGLAIEAYYADGR